MSVPTVRDGYPVATVAVGEDKGKGEGGDKAAASALEVSVLEAESAFPSATAAVGEEEHEEKTEGRAAAPVFPMSAPEVIFCGGRQSDISMTHTETIPAATQQHTREGAPFFPATEGLKSRRLPTTNRLR